MAAMPVRRDQGAVDTTLDSPLPAALAMPPAMAAALTGRTIRVPISMLHEVVHDMAATLAGDTRPAVVIFTQDYGVAHRGAAALLHQLLQARGVARLAGSIIASDTTWQGATRAPDALVVISAGPAELGADAPATRHARVIVDITPDPNTWNPRLWPERAEVPPSAAWRLGEWMRHPIVSRQRAAVRRRVAAKLQGLLRGR